MFNTFLTFTGNYLYNTNYSLETKVIFETINENQTLKNKQDSL